MEVKFADYPKESSTYQMNTRDTIGLAIKCTYGIVNGKDYNVFKDPKTDEGLLRVNEDGTLSECVSWAKESTGLLQTMFKDGRLYNEQSLADIRAKLRSYL